MQRHHERLEDVSPEAGALDAEALADELDHDLDEAMAMIMDMARATDRDLRAKARALAARLLIPLPRSGGEDRSGGVATMATVSGAGLDLDIDATVERFGERPRLEADDLRWRAWRRPAAAYILVVDASGSVTGTPLATAVMTAAALAGRLDPGDELAVVAFWSRAVVLRDVASPAAPAQVLDRLFDLRSGDTTDLALGIRTALGQAARARARRREVLVLTDGQANEGSDPETAAATAGAAGARLHVLALSEESDARATCVDLAGRGGGRAAPLVRPSQAAEAIATVLARG